MIAARPLYRRLRRRSYRPIEDVPIPGIDLEQAIELHQYALAVQNCAEGTLKAYRHVQRSFLAFLAERYGQTTFALADLNLTGARAWTVWRRETGRIGPTTIRQHTVMLKTWAHWLEMEGHLDEHPLRKLRLPRATTLRVQPFSADQVRAFAINWLRVHPGHVFHLQVLLGHATLEMTRRYSAVVEADTQLAGPSVLEFMEVPSYAPGRRRGEMRTCVACGTPYEAFGHAGKYCKTSHCKTRAENARRRAERSRG